MYFCKKTNRHFSSKQGLLNHFVKQYNNMEEAYLVENDKNPPKCKFCGEACEFSSFFKGYLSRCSSKKCIYQIKTESYKKQKQSVITNAEKYKNEYLFFIKNNLDWYISNKKKRNIVDPFFNKNIGNITLRASLHRKLKQYSYETTKCKFCGSDFKRDVLDNKKIICSDKKCRASFHNGYCTSKQIFKDPKTINNFFWFLRYYKNNSMAECKRKLKKHVFFVDNIVNNVIAYQSKGNIEKIWKCPLTGYFIPLIPAHRGLKDFLLSRGIDHKKYLLKYFPEHTLRCNICGKIILYNWFDTVNHYTKKNCSLECRNKSYIGLPYSEEKRKQQSKIMIEKIKNGEFIPNINNVWNGEVLKYNNRKYRSSWEIAFHFINPMLEYEKLKIQYYCTKKEKIRNYIVDFIDEKNKILYEVKPNVMKENQNNLDKEKGALVWCKENGFNFKFITEDWFMKNLTTDIVEKLPKKVRPKLRNLVKDERS